MVCMGSNCSSTFRDAVFDKCSLVVMRGAQSTFHGTQFKNMDDSETRLSVYAHGSGSQVHLHGGKIVGGIQGVAVHAAARLDASDLIITDFHFIGLEVCGAGSTVAAQRGSIDTALFALDREVDARFLDADGNIRPQYLSLIHI